ncbi:DotA/TraY family protein [Paraburkholderia sp. GAS42]|uniref:DotA/TraY family protein n=1 Tax=Paraburkholderia sp. GAS42 TaxID=3035135 RepID=UPI003D1E712A
MNTLTKRTGSLFALFWLAATSPAVMAQQTESIGQITSAANNGTDKSMSVLQMVFGSIVTNPLSGGGSGGMLAHLFLVMNGCILGVGAIWALYHFVSALIATGAEGEFLGQKKSSPWYVARMGGGFSMLVPVFGGYSGAQAIMLWAAMLGVGIANLSLDAATSVLASGGSMLSSPVAPQVTTLSKALYEANLCAQAANQALSNLPDDTDVSADASEKFSAKTATGKIVLMNQNGLSCGGAQIDAASSAAAATPPDDASATGLAAYAPDTASISSSLQSAQQSALTAMQATLSSAAADYIKAVNSGKRPEDPQQTINNAAQAYQQSIQAAISAAGDSISNVGTTVQSNLTRDGWIMLGGWYQSFAMANSQLTTMAKSSATGVPPTSLDSLPYPAIYNTVLAVYHQQIQQDASTSTANSSPSSSSESPPAATNLFTGTTDPQGIFTSLFPGQALVNKVISLTSSAGPSGSNGGTGINPLIGMKNLGDTILDSGWTLLAGYAAAKGFEEATGSTLGKVVSTALNLGTGGVSGAVMGAIKGVLDALGPLFLMLAIALFFFGVMLSVYLPMLPFITWFGGITSWFVIVCEGVVASPLWAFAHLDGDGEGLGQRTTHGYIFLLNLMLRPVAMVVGFILASMGIVALGTLLNTMFVVAMQNAQFGSVTGIVSILAFIVLYVGMCQTLCSSLFSMIHVIPDQMFSWIGGQIAGRVGSDMHDKSHGVLGGAVGHGRNAAAPLGRPGPRSPTSAPANATISPPPLDD